MLDLMRSDIAAGSAESSTETVARALAAPTPSDLVRLKRLAQLRARLVPGLEWDELLNEALLRALDGSRHWPDGVPLLSFILGIMRSLIDGRAQQRRHLAERALALAEPERPVLPFLMTGARELLEALPRHETAHAALLADVLDVMRGSSLSANDRDPAPPTEKLSQGELRVLRYLPTNLSRPEIATELSVSTNTVNTQIRSIYAKLGVRDRSSAVQRARELRLLSAGRTR